LDPILAGTYAADASAPRVIGYEILRRFPQEGDTMVAFDPPIDARLERAVLGAPGGRYLVPPGIDLFELGLIARAGRYELLPIDVADRPLWHAITDVMVTEGEALRQRRLLLCCYRALHATIREADALDADVTAWRSRGEMHPIFWMLRVETIEVWKQRRRISEPIKDRDLDLLHAAVAGRVATRIEAQLVSE
jgi:hypothetical protein